MDLKLGLLRALVLAGEACPADDGLCSKVGRSGTRGLLANRAAWSALYGTVCTHVLYSATPCVTARQVSMLQSTLKAVWGITGAAA